MAKSIRSKSKRKNRTEFRNTIGTAVAKANMAVVQAKLQECIGGGRMNSFDRLSSLFSGGGAAAPAARVDVDSEDGDVVMAVAPPPGKDPSKVPAKKSKSSKHARMTGQYGDKTTRKVGEKKFRRERTSAGGNGGRGRSRGRSLDSRKQRSSSKKR